MLRNKIAWVAGVLLSGTLAAQPAFADDYPPPSPPPPTVINNTNSPAPAPAQVQQPVVVQPQVAAPNNPAPVVVNGSNTTTEKSYHGGPGLIVGGLTLFGGAYAAAAIAQAVSSDVCQSGRLDTGTFGCRTNNYDLYIPVVGPFLAMGHIEGEGRNTGRVLLAIDGVVQSAGIVMAITGIALSATPRPVGYTVNKNLTIAPYAGTTQAGLGAFGHF